MAKTANSIKIAAFLLKKAMIAAEKIRKEKLKTEHSELSIRIYNPEQTETVIMLHGGPGVPDYLEDLAASVSGQRLILFDQRGVGESKCLNKEYGLWYYLDDIMSISDYYAPRFHLFGHSWGGVLAQLYAAKHQERIESLLLCGSVPGFGKEYMLLAREQVKNFLKRASVHEIGQMLLVNFLGIFGPEMKYRSFRYSFLTLWRFLFRDKDHAPLPPQFWDGMSDEASYKTFSAAVKEDASVLDPLKHFYKKTAIMYGEHDFIKKGREIVFNRFPAAERHIIPDAGHITWIENKEETLRVWKHFYGE